MLPESEELPAIVDGRLWPPAPREGSRGKVFSFLNVVGVASKGGLESWKIEAERGD